MAKINNLLIEKTYTWMDIIKESLDITFKEFTLTQNEHNDMDTYYNNLFMDTTNNNIVDPKKYFEIPTNTTNNISGYKFDYNTTLNHYEAFIKTKFDNQKLYKFFCFIIYKLTAGLTKDWVSDILDVNLNYPKVNNYVSNRDANYFQNNRKYYYSVSELFETMVLWVSNDRNIDIIKTPYIDKDYKFSYIYLKKDTSLFKSLNFRKPNSGPRANKDWRIFTPEDVEAAKTLLKITDKHSDYSWFSINPRKSKVYMFDFRENDTTFRHSFLGLYKTKKDLKLFNLNDLDNIKKLLNYLSELKSMISGVKTYDFEKYYDINANRIQQTKTTFTDREILDYYIKCIKTILYDYDYEKLYRTSKFPQDKMLVHSIELLNIYKGFEFDGYMGGVLEKGKNWCGFETEMGLLPNKPNNVKLNIKQIYHNSFIQPITQHRLYDFVDGSCWGDNINIHAILEPKIPSPDIFNKLMRTSDITILEPVYNKKIDTVLGIKIIPPYEVTEISEYYKELYTKGQIPNRIIQFNANVVDISNINSDKRWSQQDGCKRKPNEKIEEYLQNSNRYYLDQTNPDSDKIRIKNNMIRPPIYGKYTYIDRINRMNFYSVNNFNIFGDNKNYMTKYLKVFCKQLFENISMNPYTGCNSDYIKINRPNHGGLNHLRSVSMAIKLMSIMKRKTGLKDFLFNETNNIRYYPEREKFNILFLVCASFMKSLMRIDETSPIHVFYGPSDQDTSQFQKWKEIWGDLDIDEFLLNGTSIQLQGFASATLFKSIMMKTIGKTIGKSFKNTVYEKNMEKHINTVAFSLCYYPELHLRYINITNPNFNNIQKYEKYTTMNYLNKYYGGILPSDDRKEWIKQFILDNNNISEREFFATLGITCTPHYMDHIRADFSDNIFSDYAQFYRGTVDTTPREEFEIVNFAISNIIKTEFDNVRDDKYIQGISEKYIKSYYSDDKTPIIKNAKNYNNNKKYNIPTYEYKGRETNIRIMTLINNDINNVNKFYIYNYRYKGAFKELSEDFDKCYKFLNIEEDFKTLF